jgi:hypothetical protein
MVPAVALTFGDFLSDGAAAGSDLAAKLPLAHRQSLVLIVPSRNVFGLQTEFFLHGRCSHIGLQIFIKEFLL